MAGTAGSGGGIQTLAGGGLPGTTSAINCAANERRVSASLLGRFASADSIVPNAGDPLSWDRYAYVRNNPIVFNDPTGHCYNYSTAENAAKCNAYWQQYATAMQSKYPSAATRSTQTSTPTICIGIMCGLNNISLDPSMIGEPCTDSDSMSVWTQAKSGYTILNPQIQYPGTLPNDPYQGKTGQAQNGVDAWQNPSPDVVTGYSAGADSAVQYAQMQANANQSLSAFVLLSPSFSSGGWDNEKYKQALAELGIPILIVDEANQWKNLFEGVSNVTVVDNTNGEFSLPGHLLLDDSPEVRNYVYKWLSEVLR